MQEYDKICVDGAGVPSSGSGSIDMFHSSNGEVIGRVPEGTAADVDRALVAARAAFESWSQTAPKERARYCSRIAGGLGTRMDGIATVVMREAVASQTIKRVALELGGKSANILLDDLDQAGFDEAVHDGIGKCYIKSGQTCTALARMLVPRALVADAERIAADEVESTYQLTDPFADHARLGPLSSAAQFERVSGYIQKASSASRSSSRSSPCSCSTPQLAAVEGRRPALHRALLAGHICDANVAPGSPDAFNLRRHHTSIPR